MCIYFSLYILFIFLLSHYFSYSFIFLSYSFYALSHFKEYESWWFKMYEHSQRGWVLPLRIVSSCYWKCSVWVEMLTCWACWEPWQQGLGNEEGDLEDLWRVAVASSMWYYWSLDRRRCVKWATGASRQQQRAGAEAQVQMAEKQLLCSRRPSGKGLDSCKVLTEGSDIVLPVSRL